MHPSFVRRVLVLLAVPLYLSAPLSAAAAPPPAPGAPTAADLAEAKKHFETGIKLSKAQVFDSAILEFQEAYRLSHRPMALKNEAAAYSKVGDFAAAYDTLDELLRVHDADLKPAEKQSIVQSMSELAIVTSMVDVRTDEANATITMDGKRIGQTPLAHKFRVKATSHHFVAEKPGFVTAEQDVPVVGQSDVVVNLSLKKEVTTGHLVVKEKAGKPIQVIVDSKEVGPAPWEGDVEPGLHVVEGKAPKQTIAPKNIEVAKKGSAEVVLEAADAVGSVRVTVSVTTASIAIDGKVVGQGGWDGPLPEGPHRVDVTAPDYAPFSRDIEASHEAAVVVGVELVASAAAAAPAGPSEADYQGAYVTLSAFFAPTAAGSPIFTQQPSPWPLTGPTGPELGFGSVIRVGYNSGIVGVEGVGAFLYNEDSETADYGGSTPLTPGVLDGSHKHTENFALTSFGGFLGAGGRVTSQGSSIRFTIGLAPGLAYRSFSLSRNVNDIGTDSISPSASQLAFAFLGDAGILIGSTPGTKFLIGVQTWTDFSGTVQTSPDASHTFTTNSGQTLKYPTPAYSVAGPANVYIGPVIGVQFGR